MNISTCNILIFGDIILDKYYKGKVNRISPESPVPVVNIESVRCVLGGASNVANNAQKLGANVQLSGCVGRDIDGDKIFSLLQENSIGTDFLVRSSSIDTISKTRIIGNSQQITRLDFNDFIDVSQHIYDSILQKLNQCIMAFDIIVISDYNKGFLQQEFCKSIISIAANYHKIVIVDPKGTNWNKYYGASIITPNFKEMKEYLKLDFKNDDLEIEQNCKSLKSQLNIDNLIITRSKFGMTLIDSNNTYKHFISEAKDVYDVSGAGDTVIATLAVCLGANCSLINSIQKANVAGGIVVGKAGTATVSMSEIESTLKKRDKIAAKIFKKDDLLKILTLWRQKGNTIAFTNGCFDILHRGHIYSLETASGNASKLIVGINSDASVKRLKGDKRPINKEEDRTYAIASLECVDAVILFYEDTPEKLIADIKPDVLVKGNEYKIDEVAGHQYAGRVVFVDRLKGYSTTNIINVIEEQ